ncbi:MAG TPA: PAS domain-containing sensor histidine kinase [Hanamia sp.]|jgi:PAS domain S-box-containing protein
MKDAAFLNAIIENVIDGFLIIDQNGLILSVNPSVCSLFGYTAKELCGKNVNMLMPSPYRDHHDEYLQRYQLTGRAHIIGIGREIMGLRKDGDVFPARLAVSEVIYNDKKLYAGVIHDLRQEKKTEDQQQQYTNQLEAVVEERTTFLKTVVETLEQAKEEVNTSLLKEKEVSRLKTNFISVASHEFRTPLSNIQLSAALIERYYERLDKQVVLKHLNEIQMAVKTLTVLLNDFLSIEKIEAGKVGSINKEFDLKMLCEEIIDAMRMQAKKHQKINYTHIGGISKINLDSNLLQHCLFNLISNAIKYSPEDGSIQLKTEIKDETCQIWIKDNGIGIPEEDQIHLFEAFFRAQNTVDIQGTGLGLNIVKRYVGLMNGRIDFKSSKKTGTVFTLSFRVTKAVEN